MTDESSPDPTRRQRTVRIENRLGLHLRAAKVLIEAIAPFKAEVTLRHGDRSANARSILSMVTLEAVAGTEIEVTATGPQAADALAAVAAAAANRFGESE